MEKRIKIVIYIFLILFAGLTGKDFYEQVIKGPTYALKSLEVRTMQFPAEEYQRGDILDRNGISLTDSVYRPAIIFFPKLIKDPERLISKLKNQFPQLEIDEKDIKVYMKNGKKIFPPPLALKTTDPNIIKKIQTWQEPGVAVLPYKFRYGTNSLAVHLVGYMGYRENGLKPEGMMGVERIYDQQLQGTRPEKIITPITDARNNILSGLGYRILDLGEDPGRTDIVLSIDSRIQRIAEEVMDKNNIVKGSVVILDIDTGQILAAVSRPIYDQNNLEKTMGFEDNQLERVIDYKVYPGSIFKLITAAAALEEGIVKPETKFICTGESPDFRVKCPRNHGSLTFSEAMQKSCNITFINVGLQLGRENLEKYIIEKFGFNPLKDKALDSKEAIAHGIIGQVIFKVSALEIANTMATIARGGYHQKIIDPWQKRLIKGYKKNGVIENMVEIPNFIKVYSSKTAEELQDILIDTNRYGSGKKAWIEGYGSAGKTGTPQVNGLGDYMAWYTGYAPIDKPQYAAAILIEEIEGLSKEDLQGGAHAAPIFKEILSRTLELDS